MGKSEQPTKNSWMKNFLDKLAKANKEEFGDKPLDCCELNKDGKYVKKADTGGSSKTKKD